MIREYSKALVYQKCNGSIEKATEYGFYSDWTEERIKGAFSFGNGTEKDLRRYMNDNKQYCIFVEVNDAI